MFHFVVVVIKEECTIDKESKIGGKKYKHRINNKSRNGNVDIMNDGRGREG